MNILKTVSIVLTLMIITSCSKIYRTSLPSDNFVGKGHVIKKKESIDSSEFQLRGKGKEKFYDIPFVYYYGDEPPAERQIDIALDPEIEDAVKNNFIYALMASNSYVELSDLQYKIPSWKRIDRWDSSKGLGFDIYIEEKSIASNNTRLVIAFRGTENTSPKDWVYANIYVPLPFHDSQYDEAYNAVKKIKKIYPNHKIITTGHSLGGALAINSSLRIPGIDAIAFNSSPRFFFGNTKEQNKQTLLSEKGEVLNWARWLWCTNYSINKYKMKNFDKFNFYHYKGISKPFKEHSMYRLSRGLLLLAIQVAAEQANEIATANNLNATELKKYPRTVEFH